jgi:dTDP-4-amino-4,6-dideoxygalactose transaminase
MPNINAALGCAQLEDLPSILRNKKLLFKKYKDKFNTIENINLFQENEGTSSNYWLQTLVLDKSHAHNLDDILKLTNDSGYMTRPAWNLLHTLQPYKDCPRASLTVSKSLKKRILNIPSSTYNFK